MSANRGSTPGSNNIPFEVYDPEARKHSSRQWLFHYTTKKALQQITEKCFQIHETAEDVPWAVGGAGVYLTTLGPEVGRLKIMFNNYHKDPTIRYLYAKTEAFIAFRIEDLVGNVTKIYDKLGNETFIAKGWVLCTRCNNYVTGFVDEVPE